MEKLIYVQGPAIINLYKHGINIIIIEIGDGVNKLENRKLGMGWLPDYPDFRDFNIWNMQILGIDPFIY